MKFTVDKKKELTIFKLMEPRLDATIAPELKSEFVLLIEAEGKKYIIVDISQVEAIDSSGIGALLMAHRQTADRDGFAAFAGVKNRVRDLLKMTGLDKQLFIFSSIQEALNSIETVDSDDEVPEKSTKKQSTAKKTKRKKTVEIDDEDDDDLMDDIPDISDSDIDMGDFDEDMSFDEDEDEDFDNEDNDREDDDLDDEDENSAKKSKAKKAPKKTAKAKTTRKKG